MAKDTASNHTEDTTMYAGDSFDQDDALGRKKYAEFIVDMIRNGADYLQEDDAKSFSIAIDSAYGTGKTVFLRKLERMLGDKAYASEVIDVIRYNAWEADYTGDPFGAMKDAVLDEIPFLCEKGRDAIKKSVMRLAETTVAVAQYINPYAGLAAKATKDVLLPELREGKKLKKAMVAWQNAFNRAMSESGTLKLVVIIDELDRCRPDFAIQTLEIAKHLMNMENVVFVYALDMLQLCSAVHSAYGDTIDANGYLCKFFNYMTKLPSPSMDGYVTTWIEKGIVNPELKAWFVHNGLETYFMDLANKMHISLRQVDVIMRTYIIMYNQFLFQYKNLDAMTLYLLFVFLKYAKADIFDALFLGRGKIESSDLREFEQPNKPLNEIRLYGDQTIKAIVKDRKFSIETNANQNVVNIWKHQDDMRRFVGCFSKENQGANLFGCLFYPDLMQYEHICHFTLAQYLHRNMEMFFFALPQDDPQENV